MRFHGLALACGVLSAACAVLHPPSPASRPGPARPVVLGHFQTRDHRITVKTDERYTVVANDGTVVAEDVTLQQLEAIDPVLRRQVTRMLAASERGLGWAGL